MFPVFLTLAEFNVGTNAKCELEGQHPLAQTKVEKNV